MVSRGNNMRITFETSFTVDLPEDKAKQLIKLLEDFVNRISKIMKMPQLAISVGDTPKGEEDVEM
jgi:hypothetical protein